MKKIKERFNKALTCVKGASNVEIIVWISVVLVIATALFLFKDQIVAFINSAIGRVGELEVN